MATAPETADFLREQTRGRVRLQPMFGEYAVKIGAKTVALLCDDALFVRQIPQLAPLLPDPVTGFPYPGAKPWWRIDADLWEDADWLCSLLEILAEVLPEPAPKRSARRH